MSLKIDNERIALVTDNPAGQMYSLLDKKNNRELLYQADQGWSGRNPSLFPMVGSTWKNGSYMWNGKEYAMKNHGLIRYEDLDGKISEDGNSIVYTFDSNAETRGKYPFDFHFELKYTLIEKGVKITYAITNTSDAIMPFPSGFIQPSRQREMTMKSLRISRFASIQPGKPSRLSFSRIFLPLSGKRNCSIGGI